MAAHNYLMELPLEQQRLDPRYGALPSNEIDTMALTAIQVPTLEQTLVEVVGIQKPIR